MRLSADKIYHGPGGRAAQPSIEVLEAAWSRLELDRCGRHIQRQWDAAEIPMALQGASFDSLDARYCPEAHAACRAYAEAGEYDGRRGMLLAGPAGTGKSSLAVAVLRATLERIRGQRGVHFWRPAEGLAQIRLGYRSDDESPPDVMDLACNYLLVVDDLGKEKLTEWAAEQIYRLFDHLWHEQRKVIVTTNMTPQQMEADLDQALVSRILGCCAQVPVVGQDRRLNR